MLGPLYDPDRLRALDAAARQCSPHGPAFDGLTRLTARVLRVPIALISFLDDATQFFKSAVGLPEPLASSRSMPVASGFCQYVVASGEPLFVTDAREHPVLRDARVITVLGAVAYAGAPLRSADGQVLGALSVIDVHPRIWSGEEVELLAELGEAVTALLEHDGHG